MTTTVSEKPVKQNKGLLKRIRKTVEHIDDVDATEQEMELIENGLCVNCFQRYTVNNNIIFARAREEGNVVTVWWHAFKCVEW